MSGSPPDRTNAHDKSPDQALSAVAGFDGDLLLDLDETLYLRNSTEDFLDSASPGLLILILLRLMDAVKPWRFTGGLPTRDWWRVRMVRLFCPWVSWRWRRRVAVLAQASANRPLIDAVRASRGRAIIVTAGFEPIVRPLIAELGLGDAPLVACKDGSPRDRLRGKLALAIETLGDDCVRNSMVVTDSIDDRALLDHCRFPVRTLWPDARYRHALRRVYLPGQYLTEVKRPGQRYIMRGILQEDYAFWLLSTIFYATMPLLHAVGLLILLVSFWAIYERGYVDNDRSAQKFEHDPRLSRNFGLVEVATPTVMPWIWAAVTGAIAIFLLRYPSEPVPKDFALWALTLVLTHVAFKVYNRIDKSTRIWLFPGLQLARTAAFVSLVTIGPAASLALGAHVIARWVPYYLYRVGNQDWPEAPFFLSRLMFYILLWTMVAVTQGHGSLATPTAAALLFWNILRARKDLVSVVKAAHRIDR